MKRVPSLLIVVGLLTAGCGASSSPAQNEPASPTVGGMDHGGSDADFAFGSPGDPADVDRTVEVSMLDTLAFNPETIEVESGETILFRVTNPGQTAHEFVLGDEAFQMSHAAEMSDMATPLPDEPNAIILEPGETKELIWTFGDTGTVLYGCHVPGHYGGGMVGRVGVTGS